MPLKCDPLAGNFDEFERELYDYLCKNLKSAAGEYRVLGPFQINWKSTPEKSSSGSSIEVDGLIFSPNCVYVLEAKAYKGLVSKGLNTRIQVQTEDGRVHDFRERQVDPYTQADKQWKALSNFFRTACGIEGVRVKSILIFKPGSTFQVPRENRDTHDPNVPYICAVNEILQLVYDLQPQHAVQLTAAIQDILLKAIKYGPETLTPAERRVLASASMARSQPSGGAAGRTTGSPPQGPYPITPPRRTPPGDGPAGTRQLGKSQAQPRRRSCFTTLLALLLILGGFWLVARSIYPSSLEAFISGLQDGGLSEVWAELEVEKRVQKAVEPLLSIMPSDTGEATASPGESAPSRGGVRACVDAHSVAIRSGPSADADKKGFLLRDECVTLNGRNQNGTWGRFDSGWITTSYLVVEGDIQGLPVIPPDK